MDRQAGFLLALLFLANFRHIKGEGTPDEHVKYIGRSNPRVGGSWYITCDSLQPSDVVEWKRNGVSIEQEIQNEEIILTKDSTESTVSSSSAIPKHQGVYKCTSDSAASHTLIVDSASSSAQPGVSAHTESPVTETLYHALETGKKLALGCNASSQDTIYWQLNNKKNIIADESHYELLENGKHLGISNPAPAIFGNYTCKRNPSSPDYLSVYHVINLPVAKITGNSYVGEGEKLKLTCKITPDILEPEITWVFGNASYTKSKGRVNLSKDDEHHVDNAILTVDNITMADGGSVSCHATFTNVVGDTRAEGHVDIIVGGKRFWIILVSILGAVLAIILTAVLGCIIWFQRRKKSISEISEIGESNADEDIKTFLS